MKNAAVLSRQMSVSARSSLMKRLRSHKVLLLMMVPGIAYFIIFHYIPMAGVVIAFKDFRILQGIAASPWVGMKHFDKAFSDPYFYTVLKNSIIISMLKLLFGFPAPVLFALLMNEIRHMIFKKVAQTVSYLPHFISWVVLSGIFISLFSLEGAVNGFMRMFHLTPVMYMAEQSYFRWILVITDIYQSFGWDSIIYFAAIAGISQELYDSALIDGAGRFKRILYITFPMLLPTICILLILRMAYILDAGFNQIFNMYNPTVYEVSDIIDTYVYRKGLIEANYSYSTAVGLFKSVIALILIVTVNKAVKAMGGKDHSLW
ncbi:ABC transporter permease [Paenibacillus allorhizosphaerae]|uniref:Multiple-sugar transport system permease YteP n=1 Tax=Paenibacillus allorhizosphaerae TaxID=2849866 RepID=A0ABM8VA53_9BACL|nr:ABC transporter permease subunit [Paenibacillus allorhizosphaerae]CAG7615493.1 putative multiple-sugar transport system permease YteP [Paenibacillus allorhizosphaerae]